MAAPPSYLQGRELPTSEALSRALMYDPNAVIVPFPPEFTARLVEASAGSNSASGSYRWAPRGLPTFSVRDPRPRDGATSESSAQARSPSTPVSGSHSGVAASSEAAPNQSHYSGLGEVEVAPTYTSSRRRSPNPRRDVLVNAVRDTNEDTARDLQDHTERRFAYLGHLMVGLVHFPPLRVDSDLDRCLDGAQTLGAVINAMVLSEQSPSPGWDAEMDDLRPEVSYYQAQLNRCDARFRQGIDQRRKFEVLCHQASTERNQLTDKYRAVRAERASLSREIGIAINELRQSAEISDNLNAQWRSTKVRARRLGRPQKGPRGDQGGPDLGR
ncbi:hypothetical protein ON010_g4791 [Phytophthora cinnamomi]|nr:hypothetical protein ON010_g4791 [Phytophthora cinnamomi]